MCKYLNCNANFEKRETNKKPATEKIKINSEKQKPTWQATGIKVVILTNFINVQQRQQVAGRQTGSMILILILILILVESHIHITISDSSAGDSIHKTKLTRAHRQATNTKRIAWFCIILCKFLLRDALLWWCAGADSGDFSKALGRGNGHVYGQYASTQRHDICHMMWPTMRRTVAIAFVVQGHDYRPSRIRILRHANSNSVRIYFGFWATTSHNLCNVQNVATKSRFLHFSFVFSRILFSL